MKGKVDFLSEKKNVTRCATWSPFGPFCICSSYEKTLSVSILLKPLPPQAKIASEMKVLLIYFGSKLSDSYFAVHETFSINYGFNVQRIEEEAEESLARC